MSSEFERIARIKALLSTASPAAMSGVEVGIGDDCAVLAAAKGPRVWTIDSAVEGVHFRRDCMPLDAIGFRAFMAAASDLAAMGARATAALSALTLPANLTDAELDALVTGIGRAAAACVCPVIGGNLARGSELSLTTTLLGEPHGRVVLRSGAKAYDGLFLSGPVGGSALGLRALLAGRDAADTAPFVGAFLAPRARLDVAEALGRVASSGIDVSDGLVQDALHLCRASQLNARIEFGSIPRLPGYDAVARALTVDPQQALLAGGEDYELLFTAPTDVDVSAWATRIGSMEPGAGEVLVTDPAGARIQIAQTGFDHFR